MMDTTKPWETPKIQMIQSMFNGRITSVKAISLTQQEVKADEEIPR